MELAGKLKSSYPIQSKSFESWLWICYQMSIECFNSLPFESQIGYYIFYVSYQETSITEDESNTLLIKTYQDIINTFYSLEIGKLQLCN